MQNAAPRISTCRNRVLICARAPRSGRGPTFRMFAVRHALKPTLATRGVSLKAAFASIPLDLVRSHRGLQRCAALADAPPCLRTTLLCSETMGTIAHAVCPSCAPLTCTHSSAPGSQDHGTTPGVAVEDPGAFRIQTFNKISEKGLEQFPKGQ